MRGRERDGASRVARAGRVERLGVAVVALVGRADWLGTTTVALALAMHGCVSQGCPPGYEKEGGACRAPDAGASDAGALEGGGNLSTLRELDAGEEGALDTAEDAGLDAAVEPADAGPCDGAMPLTCYEDGDDDGHAALDAPKIASCAAACSVAWTATPPTPSTYDCRPSDPNSFPGASERCNDLNDDCDGTADEGASNACVYDHGSGACVGGVCEISQCNEGYDDCDTMAANGCEQALNTNGNCGACGVTCHALASCGGSDLVGKCVCNAPSFGDGVECQGFGPLAAGNLATCGVHADRHVTCWGDLDPPPVKSFVQISVGFQHACGVDADQDVDCWGNNDSGQAQDLVGEFVQVVAGEHHSCALRANGTVACWGITKTNPGGTGDYGQAIEPSAETSLHQLAAGRYHTCALRADGTVHCWGAGESREASCGADARCGQSEAPTGETDRFVQITAGEWHSCGLRADGHVTCWGAGQTDPNVNPDYGQALPPAAMKFSFIAAGSYHTCGIELDGGAVCWGAGDFDGELLAYHFRQSFPISGTYLMVTGGLLHTCALTDQFQAVCWGSNTMGQATPPLGSWPLVP